MKWLGSLLFILLILCGCSSETKEKQAPHNKSLALPERIGPNIPYSTTENFEPHYPNGRLKMKGLLQNGKREGLWISWYEDGQEWSENMYKNGLKSGPTVSWHENGKKRYEGFYTNDVKSGKWSYWDTAGRLMAEMSYDTIKK